MKLNFSKYHGLGNDFIIVNYQECLNYSDLATKICNRNIGVGSDGLIIVKQNPLTMIFYNQDGSLGSMCGNGLRCFAKYVIDEAIVDKNEFIVSTLAGDYQIIYNNTLFEVLMPEPDFSSRKLAINTQNSIFLDEIVQGYKISSVFTGTIHSVVFVKTLEEITEEIGYNLHKDPLFTKKTNVNFVQVIDSKNIKIKTYERGVGFTLACGTGALASFVIGLKNNYLDNIVNVHYKHGILKVMKKNNNYYMIGSAEKICKGIYIYR